MTTFPHPFRPHRPEADVPPLTTARAGALFLDDRGAATAEYAIATMAVVMVFCQYVTMNLAAAIYARQSVEEDELAENQVRLCQRTAVVNELGNIPESRVFRDVKVSASKPRDASTGWGRMLTAIKRDEISVVIITDTDRLMRGVQDAQTLVELGVRVLTLDGSIDTRTADGERRLLDDAVKARYEVRRKSERAVRAAAMRHEAGHPSSGTVAYGYRWVYKQARDTRGTRLEIVHTEAAAVRYISDAFLAGAKLGEIARALNDGSARDRHGGQLDTSTRLTRPRLNPDGSVKRPGARWSSTTLRRVLMSPYQAALLPPRTPGGQRYSENSYTISECTAGAWAAILSEDDVAAARSTLMQPSRRSHDGNTTAKWLLSGLAKCGECGGAVRMTPLRSGGGTVRGYRCVKGCFQRPAPLIEQFVERGAVNVLSAPGLLSWVDDSGKDIHNLRARRDSIDADEAEWFARAQAGSLRPAQWDVLSAKWAAERAQLDAEIAQAVSVSPAAAFVGADDVHDLWRSLEVPRRRAVLRALLFNVAVYPVGSGRRVRTLEAMEGTVTMNWRRAQRRVAFDADLPLTSERPGVPHDSLKDIAAALQVGS